uniref:RNB domain-containing protein n=1 Tax=Salix viminalis TaxID=40686 RepID=A0A6N2M2L1_SALVM
MTAISVATSHTKKFMKLTISIFCTRFNSSKCKTAAKMAVARIKLLRNKREAVMRQMRRDIALLLRSGQDATARIRVEHVIREQNVFAANEFIELFCELVVSRLSIIAKRRECPADLKEGIASLIFASPRCSEIPELVALRKIFEKKYGKDFVSAATDLRPNSGVNRLSIDNEAEARIQRGALTLASAEVKFQIDTETHDPLDIGMYQIREANQMVEEFMLAANDRTSRMLIGAGERRDGLYYFKGIPRARALRIRRIITGQRESHDCYQCSHFSHQEIHEARNLNFLYTLQLFTMLLRNKREAVMRQMRRDIALLLRSGQDATARIRVEHVIREQNVFAANEFIELFCELVVSRLSIIAKRRECPADLKEGIASLIFASPRCSEIPELVALRKIFEKKYGKDFVSAATDLRPNSGVNRLAMKEQDQSRRTSIMSIGDTATLRRCQSRWMVKMCPGDTVTLAHTPQPKPLLIRQKPAKHTERDRQTGPSKALNLTIEPTNRERRTLNFSL